MRPILLPIHILAGSVGIVTGFVALFVAKGAPLHRRAGLAFVYAMVTMGLTGAVLAAVRGDGNTTTSGLLAGYFVITALTTVRPPTAWTRRVDAALMALALVIGLETIAGGVYAYGLPRHALRGVPFFMFFVIGGVALLAGVGDARVLRDGPPRGSRRLARHLWRMCWALWVAAGSFFIGQAKVIPPPMRIWPLLVIPPLVALLAGPYWLWRVRGRQAMRRMVLSDVAAAPTASHPPRAHAGRA